ncbi:MAG: phosphohydrolase [Acetobacter sp.]|uniref:phosphohydrolase n=1 Tax=Acetobacter sp. TaxID=440 RepID=UPI0039EBB78E
MPAFLDTDETSHNLAYDLQGWHYEELHPDVRLIVNEAEPALTPDVEQRVQAIWEDSRARRPKLFNGRIFCMKSITPDCVEGYWTEYRRALAQMVDPTIFGETPLHQLAVCGLLRCADGIVLARRHPASLYLGDFWQSPPAGTVEMRKEGQRLSLADQLLAETEEELGLMACEVSIGPPRLAVIHARTAIVDIGISLTTPLSFAALREKWQAGGNREYDQLTVISDDQLGNWCRRKDVIPTTRILLNTT